MTQISCCCFDLETTNLNADFGVVLCSVIKPAGGKPIVFRADELNRKWATNRADDSAVVKATVKELAKYDIWVAHNGQGFDVPYLRTRLLAHGLPKLEERKLYDPCRQARAKLRVSYNSLDKIATVANSPFKKTTVEPKHWLAAALNGSKRSMDYIVDHCVQDVLVLEWVVGQLKGYISTLNSYGSAY